MYENMWTKQPGISLIISEITGHGVASLPLTWRARVRSPIWSVFLVEIFPFFFLNCKTNVGKTTDPSIPGYHWESITRIIHYGCQWSLKLMRPKASYRLYKWSQMKNEHHHKTHSSQKLAKLLCIDTAICRVGNVHSENAQVHTVVPLLLWRWA